MKSKIIVAGLFVWISQLVVAQTDWERYDLKGKVQSVTATTIEYSGGCEMTMKYFIDTVVSDFSEDGKLIRKVWKRGNQIFQIQHFSYKKGRTILTVEFFKNGVKSGTKTYKYKPQKEKKIFKRRELESFSKERYDYSILQRSVYLKLKEDKQGNWTTKTDEQYPFCKRTNTRKITYYE
ncbi:hypothetical protein AB4865_03930 [Capnocytophaga sp. ARDL2]|uniref:hypothetical protein n=1 Tax=Capnocytophaga sp. ARDL2 TaxID=3238809 RepID=UPI003557ADF9